MGAPGYADGTALARSYVTAAPERLVWGSDWPHPSAKHLPDDAELFDLLASWVPDEATRCRVLVTNPEALYGFPKSALAAR
jgi:predicted TIM-barrel fold metal-dependent hydrolase